MKLLRKENGKLDWRRIVGLIVLITLVLSIVYAIIMVISSPSDTNPGEHQKLKSDYLLMISQCILGIIVMAVPSVIEKRFSLRLPNFMYILYFVFLYCAIYLGEVRSFYFVIPHWDTILHSMSAAMLGAFGFIIIETMGKSKRCKINLSAGFIAFFAFCFALTVGTVWEIYEYLADGLFGFNMQKFALEGGENLIGRAALMDTMEDLITDAISAVIISLVGYAAYKRNEKKNAVRSDCVCETAE